MSRSFSSWKNCLLFNGIDQLELNDLENLLTHHVYAPGQVIIKEGTIGDAIFIIEKGSVKIQKDGIKLGEQCSGDYVGAMALLEKTTRSATVISTETTMVKILTINQLETLKSYSIFRQVLSNHVKAQQHLVRKLTKSTIKQTKSKLKEAKKQVQMANFFYYLILTLVIYQFVLGIYIENHQFLRQGFYRGIVTPSFILFVVIAGLLMAKKIGIPIKRLGWKFKNWKADLKEALIWTAGFLVVLIAVKWVLIQTIPVYRDTAVFESFMLDDSLTPTLFIIYNLIYAVMTPMQEFVTRGILQGSLSNMITGKYVAFKAILLSNLIFSASHLHIDLKFALAAIIPGFFWGFLYEKQQSILGVSVSHFIIGMFFFLFLGQL